MLALNAGRGVLNSVVFRQLSAKRYLLFPASSAILSIRPFHHSSLPISAALPHHHYPVPEKSLSLLPEQIAVTIRSTPVNNVIKGHKTPQPPMLSVVLTALLADVVMQLSIHLWKSVMTDLRTGKKIPSAVLLAGVPVTLLQFFLRPLSICRSCLYPVLMQIASLA